MYCCWKIIKSVKFHSLMWTQAQCKYHVHIHRNLCKNQEVCMKITHLNSTEFVFLARVVINHHHKVVSDVPFLVATALIALSVGHQRGDVDNSWRTGKATNTQPYGKFSKFRSSQTLISMHTHSLPPPPTSNLAWCHRASSRWTRRHRHSARDPVLPERSGPDRSPLGGWASRDQSGNVRNGSNRTR